jgi:hypothetical protein
LSGASRMRSSRNQHVVVKAPVTHYPVSIAHLLRCGAPPPLLQADCRVFRALFVLGNREPGNTYERASGRALDDTADKHLAAHAAGHHAECAEEAQGRATRSPGHRRPIEPLARDRHAIELSCCARFCAEKQSGVSSDAPEQRGSAPERRARSQDLCRRVCRRWSGIPECLE